MKKGRITLRVTGILLLWIFGWPAFYERVDAAQKETALGNLSGVVRVWRTKVKTEGPKSDRDVIVYLESVSNKSFNPPLTNEVMDQRGLVFIPHVLPIQRGTTVDFLNSDNDRHNVYFLFDETGETLDIGTWGPGQTVSYRFDAAGHVIALCKIHLEMGAHIVILKNPYFNKAFFDLGTQRASYLIRDVPPGKYLLRAWHKKLKMRGEAVEIFIEAGKTNQADIMITKKKYAGEQPASRGDRIDDTWPTN